MSDVKSILADATRRGLQTVQVDGVEWRRQPSGWTKVYSWANDREASFRFDELGVSPSRN